MRSTAWEKSIGRAKARPGVASSSETPSRRRTEELPVWRRLYKRWGGFLGLLLAAAAIYVGYKGRASRPLFAEEGLGYALGIIGSLLILTLLMYPLRKRLRFLRILGPVKNWFRVHMILGVVGPIAILYHANFSFGSVNSTAAMISMLLVAGSGLFGRFLYAKVHHGLYGRKANLRELLASVKVSTEDAGAAARFVPELMDMVAEYDRQVLKPPKGIWHSMVLPLKLTFDTRRGYRRIIARVGMHLDLLSRRSPDFAQHRPRLFNACKHFVREHLRGVRRVAAFAAYERLFSLWHKIHLPFFFLLLVTAVIHIIAVHVYAL